MGMLTARELRKAGQDVLVLEKGKLGQEASWAGGGILSPLHPWRYSDEVNTLAAVGHRLYPGLSEELLEQSGIDPEYTRSGLLVVQSNKEAEALLWSKKWSMTCSVLSSKEELQSVMPGLSPGFERGLWLPDIGQMRNPRLVKALKASLDYLGVRYEEDAEVESLKLNGKRITGVTVKGKLKTADKVLIASGAWSSGLLAATGDVPKIQPVKGQMVLFKGAVGSVSRILLAGNRYLIPRKDGRVVCGSTLENAEFDKSTDNQTREDLRESAIEMFPALARFELEHHWAGLRPGSPAGNPVIRQHNDIEGLYINAGHFRNGVILGIGSAIRCADLMLKS